MALISELKKLIDKSAKDLDHLQRMYNVFLQGGEEDPPRELHRALDAAIQKIKSQSAIAVNAGDKFQANTLVNRYQTLNTKWTKTLRGIEDGTIAKPRKRD